MLQTLDDLLKWIDGNGEDFIDLVGTYTLYKGEIKLNNLFYDPETDYETIH